MTGISVSSDLSAEQLEGTLGGDALSSLVLIRDTDKSRKVIFVILALLWP